MRQRRGFTLVEAVIAIVIMGLVMAILFPRIRDALTRQGVRGSRTTLIGLYSQARIIAMQQGRTAELRFDGNNVLITARPPVGANQYDTVVRPRNLQTEFGVTLNSTLNPITIDPKGYVAAEATLTAAKGGYVDTVVISKYGRVLK